MVHGVLQKLCQQMASIYLLVDGGDEQCFSCTLIQSCTIRLRLHPLLVFQYRGR